MPLNQFHFHPHWYLYISIILALLFLIFVNSYRYILVNTDKIRLVLYSHAKSAYSNYLTLFQENQQRFLFTCQIIIQFCFIWLLISLFYLWEYKFEYLPALEIILSSLLVFSIGFNIFLYYFTSIIPKYFFIKYQDFFFQKTSFIMYILYQIFYPLTLILFWLANRLIGVIPKKDIKTLNLNNNNHNLKKIFTDLKNKSHSLSYAEMFENTLQLHQIKLKDICVPLAQFISLPQTSSLEELKKVMIDNKISKILIYDQTPNNIIGYYHHLDIIAKHKGNIISLHKIIELSENSSAIDAFKKLIINHKSIVIIKNIQGIVRGMLTLEDILEELFGEINDEHDEVIKNSRQGKDVHIVRGKATLNFIVHKYGLPIKNIADITIEQYFKNQYNKVFKKYDKIKIGEWDVEILLSDKNNIKLFKLVKNSI